MILPGLVSVAFYRRRPSGLQIAAGLSFTVVVSGLLGYLQDQGTSRVWENTAAAVIGGVVLYVVVLAVLYYWYFPKHSGAPLAPGSPPSPPPA